ncbi:MAG: hypothetical protein AAF242_00150 [Bacteroidota bacterium]
MEHSVKEGDKIIIKESTSAYLVQGQTYEVTKVEYHEEHDLHSFDLHGRLNNLSGEMEAWESDYEKWFPKSNSYEIVS